MHDIVRIVRNTLTGQSWLGWMIVAGTVPVAVLGLLFRKHIAWMNNPCT